MILREGEESDMREEFQSELKGLHKDLVKMGTVIEKNLDMLIGAMLSKDEAVLQDIIDRDDIIDGYEQKIEKRCISLILKQQPVAVDLRTITSVLKIITDLERIADHCTDIAEYVLKIKHCNVQEEHFNMDKIVEMLRQTKKMIAATIDSYVNHDADTAIKISMADDMIDDYFHAIVEDIEEVMKQDTQYIHEGICLLLITKYIERMADHATNICEWIAYRVTGEHKQYN